jgi:hypothetical protein
MVTLKGGQKSLFCDMCERVYRRACKPVPQKIGYESNMAVIFTAKEAKKNLAADFADER